MILSDFIWFSSKVLRLTVSVYIFLFFSDPNLNFIGQLFNYNGNVKPWKDIKIEFHLIDNHKICLLQITDVLPETWKNIILKDKRNANNLVIFGYHIIKKYQILHEIKYFHEVAWTHAHLLIFKICSKSLNWCVETVYFTIIIDDLLRGSCTG